MFYIGAALLGPSASALYSLLDRGWAPSFGARLLRREIQWAIEAPLSESLIAGTIHEKSRGRVDNVDGELKFEEIGRAEEETVRLAEEEETRAGLFALAAYHGDEAMARRAFMNLEAAWAGLEVASPQPENAARVTSVSLTDNR